MVPPTRGMFAPVAAKFGLGGAFHMIRKILLAGSATVAFASVIPGVASATTVFLNTLPTGTPVTNQFPGLTFTLAGPGSQYGTTPAAYGYAGGYGYTGGISNSTSGHYPTANILDVGFTHPVDHLSIDFNNHGTPSGYNGKYRGYTTAKAFDSHGGYLGGASLFGPCGYGCVGFAIPGAGISHLILDNNNNHAGDSWIFELSKVSFDASGAPEPSTWAMMLSGFGFLGYMMRRRLTRAAA